jgi:LytS/YehU family sensor histidine kinase
MNTAISYTDLKHVHVTKLPQTTIKRLKLTYGEQYGIRIRSLSGAGTIIYICIPIIVKVTRIKNIIIDTKN